jgi:HEAT repeat protein
MVLAAGVFLAWAGKGVWDDTTSTDPLSLIRSGSVDDRQRAALNLRVITRETDIDSALAALIKALADREKAVRLMAIQSLGDFGHQIRTRATSTPDEQQERGKRLDVATRALAGVLSSAQDPELRAAAATALGTMATQPRRLAPPPQLAAALEEGSARWNREVAREFYGLEEWTLAPELVAALRDRSVNVRVAAAKALANYPLSLDSTIPELISSFEHDGPAVRNALYWSLSEAYPAPDLVPTLIAALENGDRETRLLAIGLLEHVGTEADAAVPALLKALREPKDPATNPTKDEVTSWRQRMPVARAAAWALGKIASSEEVITALTKMLSSGDADEILGGAEGLGYIGRPAVAAVPALMIAYKNTTSRDDSDTIASSIAHSLGRIAPGSRAAEEVVGLFIRALDSKSVSIQVDAARNLGKFGPAAITAVPKLVALREGPDSDLRRAVAAALDAIWAERRPSIPATGPGAATHQ